MSTKPAPLTHTFSITVKIDQFWFQHILRNPNYSSHASYWLRGVESDPDRGWLCWELERIPPERGEEPNRAEAIQVWKTDGELPKGWYRLDRAAALRAYEEGVRLWGADWFEQDDVEKDGVVLQRALLGEVRHP